MCVTDPKFVPLTLACSDREDEACAGKGAHKTAASCAFCFLLRCFDFGFSPVSLMKRAQAASVGLRKHRRHESRLARTHTSFQLVLLRVDGGERFTRRHFRTWYHLA